MSNSNHKGNRWRITLQETVDGRACQQPISRFYTGSQKAYEHAGTWLRSRIAAGDLKALVLVYQWDGGLSRWCPFEIIRASDYRKLTTQEH